MWENVRYQHLLKVGEFFKDHSPMYVREIPHGHTLLKHVRKFEKKYNSIENIPSGDLMGF